MNYYGTCIGCGQHKKVNGLVDHRKGYKCNNKFKKLKPCACGCGVQTMNSFVNGHNMRKISADEQRQLYKEGIEGARLWLSKIGVNGSRRNRVGYRIRISGARSNCCCRKAQPVYSLTLVRFGEIFHMSSGDKNTEIERFRLQDPDRRAAASSDQSVAGRNPKVGGVRSTDVRRSPRKDQVAGIES